MMNLIRSYTMQLKARVKVKSFKTSDAMHSFLSTGGNSLQWRVVSDSEFERGLKKTGVYIDRAGDFLNVKNIDASALAHM